MQEKKKLYLVGNAHLDPVWQWTWQEGSAEAKATIRSALDRMKEFPDFRFVCSSASVYQWIEEFDPDMFEEIRQRVKEGRFIVVNGWHVQPDCNLPSGEGFARQSLYAQRYYMEKFGVTARVGYDVDSFGHNGNLPQILKKSGMDSYIFMRPGPHEKDMDSDVFHWISPDGSSVLTYRILDPYCFNFETPEGLQERLTYLDETSRTDLDQIPFFYGVGNHGGGPTIRNLQLLEAYRKEHPEKELIYSDLSDFFDDLRSSGQPIPEFRDDLQHHASGCYAAVPMIKTGIRRSEAALIAAESFGVLGNLLYGKKWKNAEFAEAWKNVCFCHFHDSMDGCSIREVYDDAEYMLGMARNTAAVAENNALQTISWAIDTSDTSKGIPIVLFNANGFDVEETVQINYACSSVTDSQGQEVPSQQVHASSAECTWRNDTIFRAKVPALGYAVYYAQNLTRVFGKAPEYTGDYPVKATAYTGVRTANIRACTILENEFCEIHFDLHNGYIVSFLDKRTGKERICGDAAVPTVVDEYYHDTWSHAKNYFTNVMAKFADATVTVVENGPLRATVKVVSRYNQSTITQYFSLEAGCDRLKVRGWADWHEQHKMLKMAWPMAVEAPEAFYEIPFGVIARPADGEEEPGLCWTAVKGTDSCYAIVNDNTYSSSVQGSTILQTLLRSPIYGDHGGPRNEESEFTAQGRIEFRYELMPVEGGWTDVIRAGRQLNKPVTNIVENWHNGKLTDKVYSALHIDRKNIMLSACKRSEDGKALVLRLYETEGRETPVTVSGDLLPVPLKVTFTPWSVNTYYLEDGAAQWKEVLLTEFDL